MDFDEIDIENIEDIAPREPEKKNSKNGLMKALLATSICILVILVGIVGCIVYVCVTGEFKIIKKSDPNRPVYSETQMQEMISQVNEDAELLRDTQVTAAQEEGYLLGRVDLLDYIKTTLLSTNSSIDTFRSLYPDYLLVVSKGAYHFLPINKSLRLSKLEEDRRIVKDNGEIQYLDELGNVCSYKGIDVSQYQGKIKWDQVAADGVDFAFVRLFFRGYGAAGRIVEDERYEENLKGAIDNGIHVGAYVFTQAITEEEAIEEAQLAIEMVAPYANNIPIVMDVERISNADGRMNSLTPEERTNVILAFCKTIEEAGYQPYIYYNTETGALDVDNARIDAIPKWYAWYGTSLFFPYEYDIWQYKDSGSVKGINGNVDMNVAFKPFWE